MPLRCSLARLLAAGLPPVATLALVGCAPESAAEPDEPIGTFQQPIKDGYSDAVDKGVVGILDASIGAKCSGSLIAPNVVLTARHCVSSTAETVECGKATPGPLHSAKYFYVTTRANLFSQSLSDYHTVREVIGVPLDPKSSDPLLNKEDLCGRDQAILILSDNVAAAEAVPWVPRVDSEIGSNEEYYAIGFGATDDSGTGAGVRRRRDKLFVTCVSAGCPSYVMKTEFVGDTGICQGDSGGPAIDLQDRVIGVTSRGDLGCESPIYGDVHGWGQWIKETVTYAAGLGHYPAPSWAKGGSTDPEFNGPVGGNCDILECTSRLCVNSGTKIGNYCTHRCDATNPCPDGFECSDKYGSLCVEKPKPPPTTGSAGSGSAGDGADSGGCSVPAPDPARRVPWKAAALLAGVVALAARRRIRHQRRR